MRELTAFITVAVCSFLAGILISVAFYLFRTYHWNKLPVIKDTTKPGDSNSHGS